MSMLFNCGVCCMLLSIWAVVQLVVMGIFFKMEVVAFIEEAEPDHHGYEDFEDFMKQTEQNYSLIAMNCWIGAVIYLFMIGVSYLCIVKARARDKAAAENAQDDDAFCKDLAKSKKS
ncbi:unnamed protein product [Pieris macdunnoughi]|uniref:Uncharacterized protein n=1 Tax=Pieris macdunnoughi TaxID=345717 RepID=A0A821W6T7_9NEOP|nr:unnamed protein product [Pieris macdunnoughi]